MDINIEKLKTYIKELCNSRILVVGDLALDEMVYGDTERISREAPVLILQHTHTKFILGGASNAAHNVSTINNGKISVVGVAGDDYYANDLKQAFCDANVNCTSLIIDKDRKTTTKTRISGTCSHSITQQIVRIDRQTNKPLSKKTEELLINEVEKCISNFDLVILSDYHIGTLTGNVINSIIGLAKKHNIKVIVDAQKDLDKYKGVYSMTPNLPDAQKHAGFYFNNKYDFIKAANIFMTETGAKNVLITCGDAGMVLVEENNKYTQIPVFNKSEVFDVTGAGDTVTALFSMAIAIGAEPIYAAIIGNLAAGIVVKQYGCATTTIEEIISVIPEKIIVKN